MLVREYMLQHPIMIEPHRSVFEARRVLVENNIYYLPVVGDGKRLLGMITPPRLAIAPERLESLDMWEITRYVQTLRIDKVMVKGNELATISPDNTLEEAAEVMLRRRTGGLPVVEKGRDIVMGLITDNDLLIEFRNLLGAVEQGWRVTVRVPSREGEFLRLTRVIIENHWGLMAMGNVRAPRTTDKWDVVLKVVGPTREELVAALEAIEGQEIRDIRATLQMSEEAGQRNTHATNGTTQS